MRLDALEAVARALNDAGAAYLVAGGVAVNVHGHARATHDLDLVLRLTPENALAALGALDGLGYRPVLPVAAEDFANAEIRKEWRTRRNMEVFSLVSDRHQAMTIDLFVEEPFDFEEEHREALVAEIASGVEMRFVRLSKLIEMKEATGRSIDEDDSRRLRWVLEELEREGDDESG